MKCSCGKPKKSDWHLACPACWAFVPVALQHRVYDLFRQARGSDEHREAVREAFSIIHAARNTPADRRAAP